MAHLQLDKGGLELLTLSPEAEHTARDAVDQREFASRGAETLPPVIDA
jgi:hypothetical protein